VDAVVIQKLARERLGLRLGPEMTRYVLRCLQGSPPAAGQCIPIIAADARTGIPVRKLLPAGLLARSLSAEVSAGVSATS